MFYTAEWQKTEKTEACGYGDLCEHTGQLCRTLQCRLFEVCALLLIQVLAGLIARCNWLCWARYKNNSKCAKPHLHSAFTFTPFAPQVDLLSYRSDKKNTCAGDKVGPTVLKSHFLWPEGDLPEYQHMNVLWVINQISSLSNECSKRSLLKYNPWKLPKTCKNDSKVKMANFLSCSVSTNADQKKDPF